jgi:hypothetical protein
LVESERGDRLRVVASLILIVLTRAVVHAVAAAPTSPMSFEANEGQSESDVYSGGPTTVLTRMFTVPILRDDLVEVAETAQLALRREPQQRQPRVANTARPRSQGCGGGSSSAITPLLSSRPKPLPLASS